MPENSLLKLSTQSFIGFLQVNRIKRFYFVFDDKTKKVISSHSKLIEIADFLNNTNGDFDCHEGLFFQRDDKYDVIHSAAIHRTNRGQAAGGVRFWQYDTAKDFIIDGMRLAKGMTHKNALAGLWWGGGKGVIANNKSIDRNDKTTRKIIYSNFGKFITSLNGCYVTAEDVGTNVTDMKNVFSNTRFTTCIPSYLGGSGNPSIPTAQGVVSGIEAALYFLGMGTIQGKTVAVQGLGNVAIPLINFLINKNVAKIIACDIFEENVQRANEKYRLENFEAFLTNDSDNTILYQYCDVISPCATGATINKNTIPNIKARIICGAANNQLADPLLDDKLIFDTGILYVPDFLTNRMGIVNCANEQYGNLKDDPMILQHYDKNWEHSIYHVATDVFLQSINENEPTGKIALKLAEKLSFVNHPIFGHRGINIIKSLINSNWVNQ